LRHLSSRKDAASTPADELLVAYFDYHVTRLINLFVSSGSTDITSLSTVLTSLARIAFKIFLSKDREEVTASGQIKGGGIISHRRASTGDLPAARLGQAGSCETGTSLILGERSAEAVSRLDFTLTTSIGQHLLLRDHPRVFACIMEAFDRAVPLNLDFRVQLAVREEDRSFLLRSSKRKRAAASSEPLLGITSSLGSGASE
jgi:hypothetical protein